MRKLASVQRIADIVPIPDADRIVMAQVLGWKVVANKGDFNVGDLCVYFEVDSYLPVDDERYEFLRKSSYRNNEFMGEGFRIKTITLRGQISQGLVLPISSFPEIVDPVEGMDVTGLLRVVKWEVPEVEGDLGTMCGDRPWFVHLTDETRVQSNDELRTAMLGRPYYITTKMDGTSVSVFFNGGKLGVSSRNNEIADNGKSITWNYFNKIGLIETLRNYVFPEGVVGIVIQGEFCGPKIQKNRLKLMEYKWYPFNMYLIGENGRPRLLDWADMVEWCDKLGIDHVPLEETGDSFNYTTEELIERAKGKYPSGLDKEGIVIRPLHHTEDESYNRMLSFKVLNNDFLKKDKD